MASAKKNPKKSVKGANMAKKNSKLPKTSFYSRYSSMALVAVVAFGLVGAGYVFGTQAAPGNKAGSPKAAATLKANPSPAYLEEFVTFTGTYPNSVKSPYIVMNCYQDGVQSYRTGGPITNKFWLTTDVLKAGIPGNCTAELIDIAASSGIQPIVLASTSFQLLVK